MLLECEALTPALAPSFESTGVPESFGGGGGGGGIDFADTPGHLALKAALSTLGLQRIFNVPVHHCRDSYGVIIQASKVG